MTDADRDDSEKAVDALPVGSVRLSDAYSRVLERVIANPAILPPFDADWLCALDKSRNWEKELNDPEAFDDELADYVHQQKRVNIFLRQCIERRELVPCVYNPETGQTLELPRGEWLPVGWEDLVPRDIVDDYIDPNDYESPGSSGSLIRGKLRPVFFQRVNFDAWLEKIGTDDGPPPSEPSRKKAKREACKKALIILFPEGIPLTLTGQFRDTKVQEWIHKNIHAKLDVDRQTIVRAHGVDRDLMNLQARMVAIPALRYNALDALERNQSDSSAHRALIVSAALFHTALFDDRSDMLLEFVTLT
jgi:hypothetical protein